MLFSEPKISQFVVVVVVALRFMSFSALQRAENFSMVMCVQGMLLALSVSVLFSEPKISQ